MLAAAASGIATQVAFFPERHEIALARVPWSTQPWLFSGIVAFESLGGAVSLLFGLRLLRDDGDSL